MGNNIDTNDRYLAQIVTSLYSLKICRGNGHKEKYGLLNNLPENVCSFQNIHDPE